MTPRLTSRSSSRSMYPQARNRLRTNHHAAPAPSAMATTEDRAATEFPTENATDTAITTNTTATAAISASRIVISVGDSAVHRGEPASSMVTTLGRHLWFGCEVEDVAQVGG